MRYLVVANQTLGTDLLYDKVAQALRFGPSRFHIVVPATPSTEHLTWFEGEAYAIAGEQLGKALTWMELLGADADGEVGDANPMLAISDALGSGRYDEIILCTLPAGISRWLKMDLPSRVRSAFDPPVTHIVADLEQLGAPR